MKYFGLNIGGLFSQIESYSDDHYDTFITEKDIRQINHWNFNTIRLPVDYFNIVDPDNIDKINEKVLVKLDDVLDWAKEYHLTVILDLHKAPGHSFDPNELHANDIWNKKSSFRKDFFSIWKILLERNAFRENVIFEILNEPVAKNADDWNKLAQESIDYIRKHAKTTPIVIESNLWGKTTEFTKLIKFKDPNIIYSFHFYEPFLITHQQAEWIPHLHEYFPYQNSYPGSIKEFDSIYDRIKKKKLTFLVNILKDHAGEWNRARLEKLWKPVIDFREKHQVPILLGEFGCLAYGSPKTRQNWLNDVMTLVQKYDFSFTYWTYKNLHFGLKDTSNRFSTNPNYCKNRLDQVSIDILRKYCPI